MLHILFQSDQNLDCIKVTSQAKHVIKQTILGLFHCGTEYVQTYTENLLFGKNWEDNSWFKIQKEDFDHLLSQFTVCWKNFLWKKKGLSGEK